MKDLIFVMFALLLASTSLIHLPYGIEYVLLQLGVALLMIGYASHLATKKTKISNLK